MTFTIADMIVFRSEDGTMWNIAQPEKRVTFTTIPARLFTYILDNVDKIISREELLNNIWDKYGLEPSNNSINQYVSLIRKSLVELECDDEIIKTIPRSGFYITGDKVTRHVDTSPTAEQLSTSLPAAQSAHKQPRWWRMALMVASLAIAIFFIVQPFSRPFSQLDYHFPQSRLYAIGSVGNCPLYSLNKSPAEISKRKEQLARELASPTLECVANTIFIFQSGEQDLFQNSGRVFMTRCVKNDDPETNFSDCKTIYEFIE